MSKNILIIDDAWILVEMWPHVFHELTNFNVFSIVATIRISINDVEEYIINNNISYILTDYENIKNFFK